MPLNHVASWLYRALLSFRAQPIGLVAVLTLWVPCAQGSAQATVTPEADLARGLFEQALREGEAGRLLEACELFTKSLAVFEQPSTRLNLAIAEIRLGRFAEGIRDLEVLQHSADPALHSDLLAQAQRVRAQLNTMMAVLTVRLDPQDAAFAIDGKTIPIGPNGGTLRVTPGRHELQATHPVRGRKLLSIESRAGDHLTLTVVLPPTVARETIKTNAQAVSTLPPAAHRVARLGAGYRESPWFARIGFGSFFAVVGKGSAPDTTVPQQLVEDLPEDAAAAKRTLAERGYDCHLREIETSGSASVKQLYDCRVAIDETSVLLQPAVGVEMGKFLIPRLALFVSMRFQLEHGMGRLAGRLLDIGLQGLISAPREDGFRVSAIAGLGVGQIQAQLPRTTRGQGNPYAVSGLFNAQAGLLLEYRFREHIGIYQATLAHLMFPVTMFALDLTMGIGTYW